MSVLTYVKVIHKPPTLEHEFSAMIFFKKGKDQSKRSEFKRRDLLSEHFMWWLGGSKQRLRLRPREDNKITWIFGAVIGVISGVYIFGPTIAAKK